MTHLDANSADGTEQQSQDYPRDAIIFIPGIPSDPDLYALEVVAQKFSEALDKNSTNVQATFKHKLEERFESYGQNLNAKMCTIFRKEGVQETPVVDFYEMDYRPLLTKHYEKQNLLVKSVLVGLTLISNIPRVVLAFLRGRTSGKNLSEKLQLLYVSCIVFLLFVYIVTLLIALVQTLHGVINLNHLGQVFSSFREPVSSNQPYIATLSQEIIVILTAIGIFTPNTKDLFNQLAISHLCLVHYLSLGSRRSVLTGQLLELLEHILEKSETSYRHIHIVCFSFGTIISLDALFSPLQMPLDRFQRIHTLVTIGCPFDMIRTFWPNYFSHRQIIADAPKRWLNIYSPIDVFGSNFRNDSKIATAEYSLSFSSANDDATEGVSLKPENLPYLEGPNPQTISLLDWITLIGVRSHAQYWETKDESGISCFYDLVAKLYKEDVLLK